MRLRTLLPILTALLPIYAACSQLPPDESNLGATGMKLSTDIDGNTDVSAFDFTFTRVSCAGEAFIPWQTHKVESLADAHITGATQVPGNVLDANAAHLFADRFQTLAAGCYDVIAQPVTNAGTSSADCAAAFAKHVQVTDGQTAEVTLYSQCNGGDATGFIDALGILNHRPFVSDLSISPSKFVNLCTGTTPTQTLCATANDKDHDPITFAWQQTSGPAVQSGPTVISTSLPDANGDVIQCVEVVLAAAGKVTFDVTVYDMVKDPAGPGYITFDAFYAQNGYPYTSHWTGNFPLYGQSDPTLCGSGSSASSSSSSSSSSGGGFTCSDGLQNQGETGIDCGGPCAPCSCSLGNGVWFFGATATIDFSSGVAVNRSGDAALPNPISTGEGCAVRSDCNGHVEASSDGASVYDKNGNMMPNGQALGGSSSSTQSALFVPRPGSNNAQLFLFSTLEGEAGFAPLHYSLVDLTLNGGLGDVVANEHAVALAPSTKVVEKLTSVRHANGVDTWVVAHEYGTDAWQVYLVTAAGIAGPSVFNIGPVYTYAPAAGGQIKASLQGDKLISASYVSAAPLELYDFDHASGALSNVVYLQDSVCGAYGAEFSPGGALLYMSCYGGGGTYQYDLSQGAAGAPLYLGPAIGGALQRGPDGKIYQANYGSTFLSVIQDPDVLGAGSNFVQQGFDVAPGTGYFGLPNVLHGAY
jgi:hypothetical protein